MNATCIFNAVGLIEKLVVEELLAGRRATVGAVSGEETTEAVRVSVPGAVARCPGKWRFERVKQVVERPADSATLPFNRALTRKK